VVTLLTPPPPAAKTEGLTVWSLDEAMRRFKDGIPNFRLGRRDTVNGLGLTVSDDAAGTIRLPSSAMDTLAVEEGDLVYLADDRWYLGGLRSVQLKAGPASPDETVHVDAAAVDKGSFIVDRFVRAEKVF